MERDYGKEVIKAGIGGTPQLLQNAMVDMLRDLFAGKKFIGQEGRKALTVYKQNLPIQKRQKDRKVDTAEAMAPYIIVEMNSGAILGEDEPQIVDISLVICTYDKGTDREGYQDVANIKEDIVQRICTRPYFGGVFTILKPIDWALQQDDSPPYYFGAVSFSCTAPALTQDAELAAMV